jgi:hypothetical protein
MRRITLLLCLFAAVVLAITTACAPAVPDHPAVIAIQELLELRLDDVRDATAYEPYFEDAELAAALAEGSTEPTGTPRVPKWEPPYLSAEASSTADVAVIWKASDDFPEWPAVTIFMLKQLEDRWVVVDAVEATQAPEPLAVDAK